jgi:hypothetical protein
MELDVVIVVHAHARHTITACLRLQILDSALRVAVV